MAEQETGFKKIPGDIWHERCTVCGGVVDIGWVARHRRTHEAERRLFDDLKGSKKFCKPSHEAKFNREKHRNA